MLYSIIIQLSALKTLEKIDEPYYTKLKEAILNLASNPRPYGYIQLKNRNAFRIRVSHFRIIYEINEGLMVIHIIGIGHRKEIY